MTTRSDPYGNAQSVITQVGVSPDQIGFGTHAELESFVEELLERASQEIDDYCSRPLIYEEEYTESYDGTGRSTLKLDHYPVHEVHEVVVGDTAIDPENYRADSSGILERRGRWPEGWDNVEVTYDWGYEDGHGTAATVAEECVVAPLQRAVIEHKSSGMDSVSMDGYSVSYADVSGEIELTAEHKERLANVAEVPLA